VKIYTKTGDRGETSLVGGARVVKSHIRVAAYGDVDETSATIGLARVAAPADFAAALLAEVQRDLFTIGAALATPESAKLKDRQLAKSVVAAERIVELERAIDAAAAELPALQAFVLPGGTPKAAALHVARTVCRRAERRVLELARVEDIGEWPLKYVNRLSDLLFVLSRWVGKHLGETEYLWQRGLESHARKR